MTNRALRMSYLVASVAGVGFFAMSVLLLGVWPGQVLERQSAAMSPEHTLALTPSEQRGRVIYSREGCAYCHTQQIRFLHADMERFGAPTLAWETRFDYPHLWGTRRIGPDLAREASSRTSDWQFAHLYSPRSIVPDSVMPAYPALFQGSPEHPTQEARDLLAYLETLGRARELAGPEGEAHAAARCNCSDDEMAQMAFHAPELNTNPAKTRRGGEAPILPEPGDPDPGQELYRKNCASCHGLMGDSNGQDEGRGPAAATLRPRPANLAQHDYTSRRLAQVLWNGVSGTAMPAWRDLSPADLAAIAAAVRKLAGRQQEPAIPQAVIQLGARVYAANCAQCHGENGAGDGSAASQIEIAPANLRSGRPSIAASLNTLRNGIDGTPMAPWTGRLSEAELSAVAYYVRGFFQPDSGGPNRQ